MASTDGGLSEWMWRFLALMMLLTLSWTSWVMYQISAPPLVLMAAFQPQPRLKAPDNQSPGQSAQGAISFPQCCDAPEKSAANAAASSADPAKPAPKEPATARPDAELITDAVQAWAKAWSAQDVAAYLACYARDFKTPGGESRAQWESARRQRILAPKRIVVTFDAPSVSMVGNDVARITFRQSYQSDLIQASVSAKTLVMARIDGRWLIQQEIVPRGN